MKYILKLWWGPVGIYEIAEKCREAGIEITCEGTEHLYLAEDGMDGHAAFRGILSKLQAKHGTTFGFTTYVINSKVAQASAL